MEELKSTMQESVRRAAAAIALEQAIEVGTGKWGNYAV